MDWLGKKCIWVIPENSDGPDQPAHLHSLIKASIVCLQNDWLQNWLQNYNYSGLDHIADAQAVCIWYPS